MRKYFLLSLFMITKIKFYKKKKPFSGSYIISMIDSVVKTLSIQ